MKKDNRRTFLKKIGTGGAAALLPISVPAAGLAKSDQASNLKRLKEGRGYNEAYEGEYLKRVAFPIGGLGAGMF